MQIVLYIHCQPSEIIQTHDSQETMQKLLKYFIFINISSVQSIVITTKSQKSEPETDLQYSFLTTRQCDHIFTIMIIICPS